MESKLHCVEYAMRGALPKTDTEFVKYSRTSLNKIIIICIGLEYCELHVRAVGIYVLRVYTISIIYFHKIILFIIVYADIIIIAVQLN